MSRLFISVDGSMRRTKLLRCEHAHIRFLKPINGRPKLKITLVNSDDGSKEEFTAKEIMIMEDNI